MDYKKFECKNGSCHKKYHEHEHEIAYYEVKKTDITKMCKHEIEKTEHLIDAIEHKAEEVMCDLVKADQALDKSECILSNIPNLEPAAKLLKEIASSLVGFANQLAKVADELSGTNTDLTKVSNYNKQAEAEIDAASRKQHEALELIEDLECGFNEMIHCLKCNEHELPILIPRDNCHHNEDHCHHHENWKHK